MRTAFGDAPCLKLSVDGYTIVRAVTDFVLTAPTGFALQKTPLQAAFLWMVRRVCGGVADTHAVKFAAHVRVCGTHP